MRNEIEAFFIDLQESLTNRFNQIDGKSKFREDLWERAGGGGGKTRVLEKGKVFDKAGVNFSAVHGDLPDAIKKAWGLGNAKFYASGVSLVMHPVNPHVPIIHMNVRYFEIPNETWWFGGGIDLTPHYINEEESKFFHQSLKERCDKYQPEFYDKFKKWADDYFFLQHRNETRGIGGLFFDRLNEDNYKLDKTTIFNFVKDIGNAFIPIYVPLVENNCSKQFSEKNKEWQLMRRGRYVEFNLIHDKGTKFGLETGGRTESILMSLPSTANWAYDYQVSPDSQEEKTQNLLKKGIDWL